MLVRGFQKHPVSHGHCHCSPYLNVQCSLAVVPFETRSLMGKSVDGLKYIQICCVLPPNSKRCKKYCASFFKEQVVWGAVIRVTSLRDYLDMIWVILKRIYLFGRWEKRDREIMCACTREIFHQLIDFPNGCKDPSWWSQDPCAGLLCRFPGTLVWSQIRSGGAKTWTSYGSVLIWDTMW